MAHRKQPFYGVEISRQREQDFIKNLLKKYRDIPATDELRKKIYDELQLQKFKGNIKIPFKVAIHKDPSYIEVLLDTKV